MTANDNSIRATIASNPVCSEETLVAINLLVGGETHFLVTPGNDRTLVVEFPSTQVGFKWCQHMNRTVFPNENGIYVGEEDDSAAQELGLFFRFPESFYHLICYVSEGKVFFNQSANTWAATEEMNREGRFEIGYEREQFVVWMQRQISRLENGW